MIEFQGQTYYDDRVFVLHLCKGTITPEKEDIFSITICHEQEPIGYKWCLVTYRNCVRCPVFKVDIFESKEASEEYMKEVEPTVPLISLGGRSPEKALSYDEYIEWKRRKGLKEYSYKEMCSDGGTNPREVIMLPKEQYLKAVHK